MIATRQCVTIQTARAEAYGAMQSPSAHGAVPYMRARIPV